MTKKTVILFPMKYNLLGKSDLRVSEVAFGCMSLGQDDAYNVRLLHRALDSGITLFDTADLYDHGQNEIIVGKALKERRDKAVISTKAGNQWRSDGSGWDWNPSKGYILKAAEDSLKRMQTDYIDLYMLHGGTIEDPIDETIEAFELLKRQGKIRQYGISSIRPNVIREYSHRSNIACVMMQYSLLDRRPEESCLDLLKEHSVSVLARGSLAKGLLVSKPPASYLDHTEVEVAQAASAVRRLAGKDRSPEGVAVQYVLHHPAVASAVVGIRTELQLEEAVAASASPRLAKEEAEVLRNVLPPGFYKDHR